MDASSGFGNMLLRQKPHPTGSHGSVGELFGGTWVARAARVPQRIVVSEHARRQAARRGLSELVMLGVVSAPEQVVEVRPGREIRQSRIVDTKGVTYLLRVVTDRADQDIRVVTVYRTSKVRKYWRAR